MPNRHLRKKKQEQQPIVDPLAITKSCILRHDNLPIFMQVRWHVAGIKAIGRLEGILKEYRAENIFLVSNNNKRQARQET